MPGGMLSEHRGISLSDLLLIIVNNILPILIVAGVGFWVGRRFNIEPKPLGQLIFNIFSPALVFYLLSTTAIESGELGQIVLLTILFQVSMAIIAFMVLRFSDASKVHKASVVVSTFCINAGNYGLSLVSFAFNAEVLARAVIVFIANILLNNTLGVFVASSGQKSLREAFISVFRVPAVYATLAAFIVTGLNITLPLPISRSIKIMADASIPAMLILLGLQLGQSTRIEKPSLVGVSVGLKLLVAPVIAFGLVLLFQLTGPAAAALIIQASMPTAVVTIVLASEFGLDERLTLSTVLASTIASPITLAVIILLLYQSLPGINN